MASALQTQFGQQAQQYGTQYDQARNQAQSAYGNLNDFQHNMQSGADIYNQQLQAANQNAGYDPRNLQAAQSQVSQIQGILGGLPRAVQAQNANYGATAGDVAGQYATEAGNLNQSLNLANTSAANELQKMQAGLAGAQTGTQAGLQGQQNKLSALNQTYQAAQQQMKAAQDMQTFFADLYSKQGYLDAQQASAYAQAKALEAQAGLYAQQAAQTAQNIRFAQQQYDLGQAAAQHVAPPSLSPAQQASQAFLNRTSANGRNFTTADANAVRNYQSQPVAPSYLGGLGDTANKIGSFIGNGILGLL